MSLGTGLEEAISVDMDGEWKSTTPPDWLVTEGVASCIAIAIACNAPPRAWLVHAPNFGSDDSKLSKLREMLTCRLLSDHFDLRRWLFPDSLLISTL
jgi:hypothetical protein